MHAALLLLLLFMLLLLLQLALLLPLRKSVCIARNHSGAARPVTLRSVSLCSVLKHILLLPAFSIVPLHTHIQTHTHIQRKERCFASSSLRFLLCSTAFQLLQMIFLSTCVCVYIYISVSVFVLCVYALCLSLCVCVCAVHSAVRCDPRYSNRSLLWDCRSLSRALDFHRLLHLLSSFI